MPVSGKDIALIITSTAAGVLLALAIVFIILYSLNFQSSTSGPASLLVDIYTYISYPNK